MCAKPMMTIAMRKRLFYLANCGNLMTIERFDAHGVSIASPVSGTAVLFRARET
jgi:hypothetical protein